MVERNFLSFGLKIGHKTYLDQVCLGHRLGLQPFSRMHEHRSTFHLMQTAEPGGKEVALMNPR